MQFVDLIIAYKLVDLGICGHLIVLVVELYQVILILLQFIHINFLLIAPSWAVLVVLRQLLLLLLLGTVISSYVLFRR